MAQELRLTNDQAVKALKPADGQRGAVEYRDPDHPGYYLRLSYGGSKQFFFRYKRNGIQYKMGLGRYGHVKCSEAYSEYSKLRERVDRGEHPAGETSATHSPRTLTLARLFDDYYKPQYIEAKLRDKRTGNLFDVHVRKVLGKRAASKITPQEIHDLLAPLEAERYHAARKTLSLLRHMYKWAAGSKQGYIYCANPCSTYELDDAPPPPEVPELKQAEIKRLWKKLGDTPAGRALKVQLLTVCRADEVAGMVEAELDRDAKEWLLPADRNKGKRLHIVPLTDTVLQLIGSPADDGVVFSARADAARLTASGMSQAIERACKAAKIPKIPGTSTHLMRKTATTLLDSLGVDAAISDLIANHSQKTLRQRRYSAHKFINERREALEALEAKVLQIVADKKN